MHYFTYIALFIFFSLVGCKKEPLPQLPENNNPIYKVKGIIAGEEINFNAGIDGMYMETNFYYLNNVLQFNARLNNQENNFQISFADANIDIPTYNIDFNTINEFNLANMDSSSLLVLNKDSFSNADEINAVSWTIDGVEFPDEEITIYEPGRYSVCALVDFNNGTQNQLCNEFILGYQINSSFGLRHYINQSGYLNCFIDVPETTIESVKWKINGDPFSTSNTISFLIESQPYHIEAEVNLKNGVKRTKRIFIDGSYPKNFIEDFTVHENQIQEFYWDLHARMAVNLNGSIWVPNNPDDTIIISNIKENGVNDEGQTIYEISGLFDGTMLNKKTLQETNGSFEFKLAFAIP